MSAALNQRHAWRIVGVLLLVVAVAAAVYWRSHKSHDASGAYRTAVVDRGEIRVAISATGTLSAISTVQVGSQISGQVTAVLADFNDHVSKGEVLARIDPSTYQAQIAQGAAAVNSARASLAGAQATLHNAQLDYTRKAGLAQQELVARSDADLARASRDQAGAQVNAARAQIAQQQAAAQTAQLNLQRTVIRSPVDGVVLTRTIEPGQTVAASLQAPVLFTIAEDLSKMEIVLAIDEADIGQVRPDQAVSFSVDAFPDKQYRGQVQQVRLSASNTNNVITYPVVVAVDNSDKTLLPGMTANAEIEVSRKAGVLRIPNSALRFKPAEGATASATDMASSDATPGHGGSGIADALPPLAHALSLDSAQQSAFDSAIAALRASAAAHRKPPSSSASSSKRTSLFGGRGGGSHNGGNTEGRQGNAGATRQRMLTRMTQQFAAFRATLTATQQQHWDVSLAALASEHRAPIYLLVDGQPKQVMVRIGASDGTSTEVSGRVHEGDQVIIGAEHSATSTP